MNLEKVNTKPQVGQKLNQLKAFRDKIIMVEDNFVKSGLFVTGNEVDKRNPVKHSFAEGCYIREIFNPRGEIVITKIHKQEHPFFLMQGKMSILTENGIKHIKAPFHGITKPGTKRIIYAHEDCVFITVHATKNTDLKKIEEEVIAKDFNDPTITLEDIKLLKNENNEKFKQTKK